jgi:predicted permease
MTATFWNDVKYALRQLWKTPGFTLTAVLTLALGTGVNAAMFSVMDQVLLRPLPYKNADRLVRFGGQSDSGRDFSSSSLPDAQDFAARSRSLQGVAWYSYKFVTLGSTDEPKMTPQVISSTNLFDLLGVRPMLGRGFISDDGKSGRTNVVIVGYNIWKEQLHGAHDAIGSVVKLNSDPYTVIGVLPPGMGFPSPTTDDFMYSPIDISDKSMQDRSNASLSLVGLMRPGVEMSQAQLELNGIRQQLYHEYPKDESKEPIRVVDYRESLTRSVRPALLALTFAVIAVWLIACANVAGLMLTRINGRRREIAIRSALGAMRTRLMQQFFTECMLLAFAGGAAGVGIAAAILRILKHYLSDKLLYGENIHINIWVGIFLFVSSCLSAVFFGLVPAWISANAPAQEGLRETGIAAGGSKRQALLRDAVVVTEITLTLALLIAAGLMIRTLLLLQHADLGFMPGKVITGQMFLPTHGTGAFGLNFNAKNAPDLIQTFYTPLEEKLEHTPGITAAGLVTVRPLQPNWSFSSSIWIKGRPKPDAANDQHAVVRAMNAGYFQTFGIKLLKGRFFGEQDTPDSPLVAVVNQAFARMVFPNEDPIGKQINVNDTDKEPNNPRGWATIVGVADNVRQLSAGDASQPEFDLDLMQFKPGDDLYPIIASFFMNISVQAVLAPDKTEKAIRTAVHQLQPDIAIEDLMPMEQIVENSMGNQTLAARLLGIFGLASLAIAVAGIYGLLSYSVSQRTREFGVRLALGSPKGAVIWLVLRHALLLLGIGIAAGIAIAVAASGVMRAFIYGLHGYDIFTVFAVALVLAACGLIASYIPARKAASVDPVVALRTE